MWRSICLVMKKFFQPDLTSFDPSKKIICQNRINKTSQNVAKMLKKICLNLPKSAKMLKKICLKNKIIRNKIWSIKVVKKYLFSNEKKNFSPIWRHLTLQKNYLPKSHQQNQPKCLRKYAWICQIQPKCLRKYAWKIKSLEIKSGKAKLRRSIWLVMKKKISATSSLQI